MPVYFYRWPSGDCSFVTGRDKIHAARALDEYGDPDPPRLMRVSGFMLHLRLDDNGKFALIGFGEVTEDFVFEHGYPLLNKLRFEEEYEEGSAEDIDQEARRRAAVLQERDRIDEPERNP